MSSSALKMKDKLEKIKREREVFEEKKKSLDMEMARSRLNLRNISKGMKNKEITETSMNLSPADSPRRPEGKSSLSPRSKIILAKKPLAAENTPRAQAAVTIVPSGPRVSDWCFLGALESDPPAVKTNTVYETIRLLGRGAFGDVNLVKCIENNRLFAMKTIFTEREVDMKDTLREVRFLRMNRHPCIIDVHDGFMTSQPRMLFIVMPYCEGGDLDSVIKAAKKNKSIIQEDKIIKWIIQIGLGLHFLHENGVVHRDLKPNNIMLTEGGDLIKLVDFGLALSMNELSDIDEVEAGTPLYTAPEMIQNLKYSYPVDCWSLGVLLHELLCLSMPFGGGTTGKLVNSILNDKPPKVSEVNYSEGMRYIAEQLLLKDQKLRMGMGGMLLHPLLHQKTNAFPALYKPKTVEERIRRGQSRQLTSQVEGLLFSKNSSLLGYNPPAGSIGTADIMNALLDDKSTCPENEAVEGDTNIHVTNNNDADSLSSIQDPVSRFQNHSNKSSGENSRMTDTLNSTLNTPLGNSPLIHDSKRKFSAPIPDLGLLAVGLDDLGLSQSERESKNKNNDTDGVYEEKGGDGTAGGETGEESKDKGESKGEGGGGGLEESEEGKEEEVGMVNNEKEITLVHAIDGGSGSDNDGDKINLVVASEKTVDVIQNHIVINEEEEEEEEERKGGNQQEVKTNTTIPIPIPLPLDSEKSNDSESSLPEGSHSRKRSHLEEARAAAEVIGAELDTGKR